MKTRPEAPRTIDEYMAELPDNVRSIMEKIRVAIREAAPEASEKISYQIPTFDLAGNLVHFAAFKNHIGFYPTSSGIAKFEGELSGYEVSRGTVRLPLDRPIPYALIRKIVKFRVKENLGRVAAKQEKTPAAKRKAGPVAKTAATRKGALGTDRRIALLRGINVGTAKRIAMADLRSLFEELGFREVRTLLNSGNVVYAPTGRMSAGKAITGEPARIGKAIRDRLGVATEVFVLGGKELVEAIAANPFAGIAKDPSRMLIMVLADARAAVKFAPILKERWAPEAIAVHGRVAYLWCPLGITKGKLWTTALRMVGEAGTARNLATMTKLAELARNP